MRPFPELRLHVRRDAPADPRGRYVLYWMIAARRCRWNFGLQRAADWARELGRPLVVLEALRCGYPYASDRLHRFVLQGMTDNARRLERTAARYYPYVEEEAGAGKGLLEALGADACVTVTDLYPTFFLPRMVDAALGQVPGRFEQVDSNGLLPLEAAERVFPTAHSLRRHLQKELRPHLEDPPRVNPLARLELPAARIPSRVTKRWPPATASTLQAGPDVLASLPIDHSVPPVEYDGGSEAGRKVLKRFVGDRLARYDEDRNHPDRDGTSDLSPYLHFGHVSAHQVFAAVTRAEEWTPGRIGSRTDGSRTGWWNTSAAAESFLDQVVTWRELGFNMCHRRDDHRRYESLAPWARRTLEDHQGDERPHRYSLAELRDARTHDELWNAAQRQLLREGRIHNYLRMLWGKKILEWSASPRKALQAMIELNDRYAVDGRDPNSYSGIFWVLGRYDRAWGPERPIYGNVRYMSSDSARRKLRLKRYLERFGGEEDDRS